MKQNKSLWVALFVLFTLFLGVWARADGAPADLSGTYANDKLTLQIHRQGDGYAGAVTMGQRQYPLTATAGDNGLKGAFTNGDDSFDFTATISGTGLNFATGHATYQLNRKHNPLEEVDNAPPTPAPAPAPSAPANGDLIGKWTSDGHNPGGKFTLTLEKGGSANVEDANGSSSSMDCTLQPAALTFSGSVSMNDLSIGGTWKVKWLSADSFRATDDNGKTYTMTRVGAPAPANNTTPLTPTHSVSPDAPAEVTIPSTNPMITAANLTGAWRLIKGNTTITLTFNADGTCTHQENEEKESGTWKLRGNTITVSHPDGQTPPQNADEHFLIMTLDARHLEFSIPNEGKTITLDRVEP